MNIPRYTALYGAFHGCSSPNYVENLIVLNFQDMDYDPWVVSYMAKYESIHPNSQKPFVQALKVFFNIEDQITVTCQNNTWTALLGNSKQITPMYEEAATFQMYATPYFVDDPAMVAEYMRGVSQQASDIVFSYKNCVLFLDKEDLPFPGGNYFKPCRSCTNAAYRICILSKESTRHVLSVADEWKNRVESISFLTKDTIQNPSMIPFQTVVRPFLPEERAVSTGTIQKRLSMKKPHLLLQDILNSFSRNDNAQQLGLVIEWPFRIAYEGTRTESREAKEFVALAVNGSQPTRVLFIRFPYEMYTQFHEVPVTVWTPIYYVNTFLKLPPDTEKVCIDSVVMGYKFNGGFFCFGHPVLEGRPARESQRGVESIFKLATLTNDFKLLETYRYDENSTLNKVIQNETPYPCWCLTKAENTHVYPSPSRLPKLVSEWLGLFQHNNSDTVIDVRSIQMALTLVRHKICFMTKIHSKANLYIMSDDEIELKMGAKEAEFVNTLRVEGDETVREKSSCTMC